MKTRHLLALAPLALALVSGLSAQSVLLGKNIFPEGGFDIYGESRLNPSGWKFPDRNDRPWALGFRAEAVAGEKATNRELRIVHPEAKGVTIVTGQVQLPAKVDRLRVNFRMLPNAVVPGEDDPAGNGAGIFVRFYDAAGTHLRGVGGWAGGLAKSADTEWQERESVYSVPTDAVRLELSIIMRSASGDVRFDDIEVVPVTMSE